MQFRRHLVSALAAGSMLVPVLVHADTKWYDKVTVGGYAEGSYTLFLNQDADFSNAAPPQGVVANRVFADKVPNNFVYSGELTLNYKDDASKTGAMVDVLYGALGAVINNSGGNKYANDLSIGQAYLTQGWGPLSLDLGKFATPVGYETWSTPSNANFSRSLTYSLEPFYSLGAKLDYAGPAGFGANLWVDNGTTDILQSGSSDDGKGLGLALSYNGIKNLALNAQYYRNQAGLYTGSYYDTANLIDFNAAYTMGSFVFAGEYLYTTFQDGNPTSGAPVYSPKINAYALYCTYNTPVQNLSVSGRFEQVANPDGGTGTIAGNTPGLLSFTDLTMDSYTLTVKYGMGPVTDILEYRADAANGYDFATNGNNFQDPSQINQTVTLAATYGF